MAEYSFAYQVKADGTVVDEAEYPVTRKEAEQLKKVFGHYDKRLKKKK